MCWTDTSGKDLFQGHKTSAVLVAPASLLSRRLPSIRGSVCCSRRGTPTLTLLRVSKRKARWHWMNAVNPIDCSGNAKRKRRRGQRESRSGDVSAGQTPKRSWNCSAEQLTPLVWLPFQPLHQPYCSQQQPTQLHLLLMTTGR